MAGRKREEVTEKSITGLKYFDKLMPLLERLHEVGCEHLFSHDEAGIQIQAYCAIIACMLISLWTGRKPTQRTYEMICYYFLGLAEEGELLSHLAKLYRHDESKRR